MSPMLIQCTCGQRVEGEDEQAALAAAHGTSPRGTRISSAASLTRICAGWPGGSRVAGEVDR